MKADNEFLIALVEKLAEICDNCDCIETRAALDELIEVIVLSVH